MKEFEIIKQKLIQHASQNQPLELNEKEVKTLVKAIGRVALVPVYDMNNPNHVKKVIEMSKNVGNSDNE